MVSKVMRAALVSAAIGGIAALSPFSAGAQSAKAPASAPADPVVARVNGKEIKRSDVISAIRGLGPQAQQVPPQQLLPAIYEELINKKLVSEAGYKQNLQNSPEAKEMLKRAEEDIVSQVYINKAVEPKLTEDAIKRQYAEYVKTFKGEEEVRARHILVKTKPEAEALIKQINGGADFVKLASEQKIDTAAAQNGGDLGYFTADAMVEPFSKAAFAMKPGEVSKTPVETQFGFHVIKVEDHRKQPQPTLEQVEQQMRGQAAQQIITNLVQDLRKNAKIETFNMDGSPTQEAPVAAQNARPSSAPAPKP
jgi:peptidyl-prolyl cis-trans isomerase C